MFRQVYRKVFVGYYEWDKGMGFQLTQNFHGREFECRCGCVKQKVSKDLVERLQRAREEFGKSVHVTSGYRCLSHNKSIGSKETSQHILGNACDSVPSDFTTDSLDEWILVLKKHFKAIGLAVNFVHVDTREDKERQWKY